VSEGETILEAARESGVEIKSLCPEISQPEKQRIRKTVIERTIKLNPAVLPYYVEVPPPSLNDPVGDFDRLRKSLSEKYPLHVFDIDYPAFLKLPRALREGDWKATAAFRTT